MTWKPKDEGLLSASEAKQVWLEREVQSLRNALAKVSVPTAFHESGKWKFSANGSNPGSDPAATALAMNHGARALYGGSGDVCLRPRYLHGEHLGKDRALEHGEISMVVGLPCIHQCGNRAPIEHGEHQRGAPQISQIFTDFTVLLLRRGDNSHDSRLKTYRCSIFCSCGFTTSQVEVVSCNSID